MAENNSQALPAFASLNEMVEYFDTPDLGDYLMQMPEVHFEVNLRHRTHLIALEEDHLEEADEFDKEVAALSRSEKFIGFLKERAKEPATFSLDEVEKELGLR